MCAYDESFETVITRHRRSPPENVLGFIRISQVVLAMAGGGSGPVDHPGQRRAWSLAYMHVLNIAALFAFVGPVSYTHLTLPTIYSV